MHRQVRTLLALLLSVMIFALPVVEGYAEGAETAAPTAEVTVEPTAEPTATPTIEPTAEPTATPTIEPTAVPTAEPTVEATAEATAETTATEEPTAVAAQEEIAAVPLFEVYDSGTSIKILGFVSGATIPASLDIPATIDGKPVVEIDPNAFKGNTTLTNLTIAGSVVKIGAGAFSGCTALVSATLASGVTSIGDEAFSGCTALETISLPYATLTYIGVDSFNNCPLTSAGFIYSIKNEEATLERYTGTQTTVVIADAVGGKKVSTVAVSAFSGKTAVTEVTIGANIRKIGASAFAGLVKLAKVNMNANIAEIGANAFDGCAALAGITLPDSVLTIGARAFADTFVKSVEIPKSVTTLAASAFDGCAISSIEIDAENLSYSAIDNLLYDISTRTLLRAYGSATEITVPTSVISIGESAFSGKTALTKVILPTTATSIGASAFSGCSALATLVIPDSVTSITDGAFLNCTKLVVNVYSATSYAYVYCKSKSITVSVLNTDVPPTAMTLSYLEIGIGNKTKILPTFTPANATCDLSFASSNSSVVSVDANGFITGKKLGKATVYVATDNGLMGKCTVRVLSKPSKIVLGATSRTMGVGQTLDLDADLPSGTGGSITYSTNDAAVAKVDVYGIVTAVGQGAATITATTYNNKSASCRITVIAAPTKLTLTKTAFNLGVGQKSGGGYFALSNGQNETALLFTSDNPTVATVSGTGDILARQPGFATITVSAYNGSSDPVNLVSKVTVAVQKAPTSFSLEASSATLFVKQAFQITPKLPMGTAAGFTYSSSKTSIATVDAAGIVTAKKNGSCVITVKSHNGLKKTVSITVKKAATSLKLNVSTLIIGVADTYRIVPTFNSGAGAEMTYSSDATSVATVDEDGDIVALKVGTATITATTHNGLHATCVLTVCAAPASLVLALTEIELGKGQAFTLSPVVKDINGNNYQGRVLYKTSVSGIATVSASGVITAKNPGTVTITIGTYNGLTDSIEVTVKNAPKSISLDRSSGILAVGGTGQLTYKLGGKNPGGCVTFKSSNPAICTVDDTGFVTGISAGVVTITALTYNNCKATCVVTVKAK